MNTRKIVIDTNVITDHLTTRDDVSQLRRIMRQYFCYTTVFNAAELFAMARTENEAREVENAMHAMKVLGMNGKSAKKVARMLKESGTTMTGLIAGVCIESKLPIVTLDPNRFKGIKHLEVRTVKSVFNNS